MTEIAGVEKEVVIAEEVVVLLRMPRVIMKPAIFRSSV